LTKTNFVLGEEKPDFKSVNQNTFTKHQLIANPVNKELVQDLRSKMKNNNIEHHFVFGNETGDQLASINHQDYKNPKLNSTSQPTQKLDSFFLRASHFSIGDKCQNPLEQYSTTYNTTMQPKKLGPVDKIENHNFKSNIILNETGNGSYLTESNTK
jgi:hypothetical protein